MLFSGTLLISAIAPLSVNEERLIESAAFPFSRIVSGGSVAKQRGRPVGIYHPQRPASPCCAPTCREFFYISRTPECKPSIAFLQISPN
jgi:hypothetical protein